MAIRTFVAVELADSIHRQLGRLQQNLRNDLALPDRGLNWVRPDHIHLTLKFLGDVEDRRILDVCQAVSDAAADCPPFELDSAVVGSFPPNASARVIWAGIDSGVDPLARLQKSVEEALAAVGFPRESRKFSPHLTLARIKNIALGNQIRREIEAFPSPKLGTEWVEELTVFQSVLSRQGPDYTALHRAPLRKSG